MATRRALLEKLEQLRAELTASDAIARSERERIEQLIADVRAHADEDGDEPQTLVDRLQEATEQFEQTHPRLTLAIGAVADALSRLGI
jgi:ElaB/YqjD/DUF883 family membrane-anchored ribosome-binding protein